MIKNVKSSFIIKKIFRCMNETTKLKLIKYTKDLQKINNISIINYKFLKGRYIIYESKKKEKNMIMMVIKYLKVNI